VGKSATLARLGREKAAVLLQAANGEPNETKASLLYASAKLMSSMAKQLDNSNKIIIYNDEMSTELCEEAQAEIDRLKQQLFDSLAEQSALYAERVRLDKELSAAAVAGSKGLQRETELLPELKLEVRGLQKELAEVQAAAQQASPQDAAATAELIAKLQSELQAAQSNALQWQQQHADMMDDLQQIDQDCNALRQTVKQQQQLLQQVMVVKTPYNPQQQQQVPAFLAPTAGDSSSRSLLGVCVPLRSFLVSNGGSSCPSDDGCGVQVGDARDTECGCMQHVLAMYGCCTPHLHITFIPAPPSPVTLAADSILFTAPFRTPSFKSQSSRTHCPKP